MRAVVCESCGVLELWCVGAVVCEGSGGAWVSPVTKGLSVDSIQ